MPHFSFPFQRQTSPGAGTLVAVDEQGTVEEIESNEARICVCPVGARTARPEFGIPWPLFGPVPIDLAPIQAAMQQFEDRGTANPTQYLDLIALGVGSVRFDIATATEDE